MSLKFTILQPLCCQEQVCDIDSEKDIISQQKFEITNIQKLYKLHVSQTKYLQCKKKMEDDFFCKFVIMQESMELAIEALFKVDGNLVKYDKKLDLGYPLVSSVMCLWDNWLLGDRCKTTAVQYWKP